MNGKQKIDNLQLLLTAIVRWFRILKLADRVCPIGTNLKTSNENLIWVGSPLRVHRRCEKPMFDISNAVAYDRLMVYGTIEKQMSIPVSSWIHVPGDGNTDRHWVHAEGQELEKLILSLHQSGVRNEQIFLISPFRSVVRYLRELSSNDDYKGIKSRTIHTVQGKEADVFLFLKLFSNSL